MKTFVLISALMSFIDPHTPEPAGDKEAIVRRYFSGWEKKDWSIVASTLADGFTFTSPAPDDHIPTDRFHDKCWPQAPHIRTFEFVRIMEQGDEVMAIMQVITVDNKVIRNVEYFRFEGDKIKSIEVFFGGTGAGFPTNAK